MSSKPGAQCTVCAHLRLAEINTALQRGAKHAPLARQHGLDRRAIGRHASKHLPKPPAPPEESQVVRNAKQMFNASIAILKDAQDKQNPRVALSAIGKALASLETIGKADGLISSGTTVNVATQVNVANMVDVMRVRDVVLEVLSDQPELRHRLASRLLEISSESGR